MPRHISALLCAAAMMVAAGARCLADEVGDFYRGKTIDLFVGYTAGGGYDIYARLIARYLGRHLPGSPTVVVRNMEGAGSLRLANWLYAQAPKDGATIGTIGRGVPFDKLLGRPGIQFDATNYAWIGSANDEVAVCVSWAASDVRTFADLRAKQIVMGAAGAGNDDDQFPRVINAILGTQIKIVNGYPGGNDVTLALERGEVSGRCGWSWSSVKSSRPSWVAEHKINVLLQLALSRHDDLPDVPLVMDLAANDADRRVLKLVFARQALGRPFLAPPGIPAERLAALRHAFAETMDDPGFRSDAEKDQVEIRPIAGVKVQSLVKQVYEETTIETSDLAARILR